MCVRQSRLETLHRGLSPITRTGDYSDVVVVDADGRRIPWPEVSRFDEAEDPDFLAWSDFVRPQTYKWDKPKIDSVMMHYVREYARVRGKDE